jgi:AraC family transcriptional regulator
LDEGEVVGGELVVLGGDPATLPGLVEEPRDKLAGTVEVAAKADWLCPVPLRRMFVQTRNAARRVRQERLNGQFILPVDVESNRADALCVPRLFFEDGAVWQAAIKLKRLIEASDPHSPLYLEALGTVLAHELARPHLQRKSEEPPSRGGLAPWQQRILVLYIEEHLPEELSVATLARLVRLSRYHFGRCLKQSIGLTPHRYHMSRRIERAKALLVKPQYSVTEIGLTVGFRETSSFTAFRRTTGSTPSAFRQSL